MRETQVTGHFNHLLQQRGDALQLARGKDRIVLHRLRRYFAASSPLRPWRPIHSCIMGIVSLAGRKCVITGASRGIGAAIARRFAQEGAVCTLVGRNRETLAEVVRSLAASHGNNSTTSSHVHVARHGDVAERSFWEELAREMVRHHCGMLD
jgi:hypothetical protein